MKIKVDGKELEVTDEVGGAIQGLIDKNLELEKNGKDNLPEDEQKAKDEEEEEKKKKEEDEKKKEEEDAGHLNEKEKEKKRADRESARADSLAAENKKLKEGNLDDSRVDALVMARTHALSVGSKVLDKDMKLKMDSMSTSNIKKAIVESESGDKMGGKSDVYIDARFDHIAATADNSDKAHGKISTAIMDRRKEDAEKVDAAQARKDRMKKDSDRWKEPVGKTKASFGN